MKIIRRLEIESMLRELEMKDVTLSKNANELTGYVMCGNVVTASFEKGKLTSIDPDLAPLVISRTASLEEFLKLRVIDMSRKNARLLKKLLQIHVDEDYKTSLYSYALSISDRYWFKPRHSKLRYHEIVFDNDGLFETSLKGEVNLFYGKAKLSPELTTPGSFEKGWRNIDGEWWLYKKESAKQKFSELFCCRFASILGVKTVTYELAGDFIRCKNFSPTTNFDPMASLVGDNERYDDIFDILYGIDKAIAKDYLKLIFFDTVVNNIDRHKENYGLLRDPKSGKVLSLAPNFDNNLALIAVSDTLQSPSKDGFVKLFTSFIKKHERAKSLFHEIVFPSIGREDILPIVGSIRIEIENVDEIIDAVLSRYEYLKNIL